MRGPAYLIVAGHRERPPRKGSCAFRGTESGSDGAASSGWLSLSARSRPPAPGGVEKRFLGVERIRLDQHTAKIELAEQLFEHRPLMVFAGGVASLAVAVRL